METNQNSLLLFRFEEKVRQAGDQAKLNWPEIPAEAMNFFAGEVLASGVVLWALMTASNLDSMRWPGDLPVILGLKSGIGAEEAKIGQHLEEIQQKLSMVGAEVDRLQAAFLQLLQWKVVGQLYTTLFANQRMELVKLMTQMGFDVSQRGLVLTQIQEFLKSVNIDSITAKVFFEKALNLSLQEARSTFTPV